MKEEEDRPAVLPCLPFLAAEPLGSRGMAGTDSRPGLHRAVKQERQVLDTHHTHGPSCMPLNLRVSWCPMSVFSFHITSLLCDCSLNPKAAGERLSLATMEQSSFIGHLLCTTLCAKGFPQRDLTEL